MKNILMVQIFLLKKTSMWKKLFVMFLITILASYVILLLDLQTVSEVLPQILVILILLSGLFVVVAPAEIIGNDFSDRTINHEITEGSSRRQIFFARFLFSSIIAVVGGILIWVLPMLGILAFAEWGTMISLSDLFFRILLQVFPFFRMTCVMTFLCCILKNGYFTMAVGTMIIMGEMVLAGMVQQPFLMSTSTLYKIMEFEIGATGGFSDWTLLMNVALYSVGIGAGVLFLGYRFFAKDDIR